MTDNPDSRSYAKRFYDGISSITIGELVAYGAPTLGCLFVLWTFFEPVMAGQIEKAFDKYGVSKNTFTEMNKEFGGLKETAKKLKQSNEELKSQVGTLVSQQTAIQSQNRAILEALDGLKSYLPPQE